ncbi:MAG: hypothetical protein JXX28_15860 [Deltaproteobacteria bacterium]|nr:hypothetical protein [Deltaproteobacteria bacterium]
MISRPPPPQDRPTRPSRQGVAALVVPPFAPTRWPSLGVHALAAAADRPVEIRYSSLRLAAELGPALAEALSRPPGHWLLGERLFARAAHGLPPLGGPLALDGGEAWLEETRLDAAGLLALEGGLPAWVEAEAEALAAYGLIGFSVSFEQLNAAIALARAVRRRAPQIPLWIGGAAASGEQGAALTAWFDAVFSGEAEGAFRDALGRWHRGEALPAGLILCDLPDVSALPAQDLRPWWAQVREALPEVAPESLWLAAETSRGCAWGRCAFCGLNGAIHAPRALSPQAARDRVAQTLAPFPTERLTLADNLLGRPTRRALLEGPGRLFAEVRPDLTLDEASAMAARGWEVQAGIEALSTPLLDLLGKGTRLRQVLQTLLAARETGLPLHWNLLYGIPGDTLPQWEAVLALLPLLRHLPPPASLSPIRLDRFAPYAQEPSRYGISALRTPAGWAAAFPPQLHPSAPWWEGEVPAASLAPALLERISGAIADWRGAWSRSRPTLQLQRVQGAWLLSDSRGRPPVALPMREDQARALLSDGAALLSWRLRQGYAVWADDRPLPLVTAAAGLRSLLQEP